MSMIYRIKIVDNGKFVRYVREDQYLRLMVNKNGGVDMRWISNNEIEWQDVSDTHKVEWGIMTSDKHGNRIPIYDGDIYVDWNTGLENEHTRPSVFHIWNMEHALDEMFPMIEVIGNANLNPELLEGRNDTHKR